MTAWLHRRMAPTGSGSLATPLPTEAAVSWATTPAAGAVVSFLGVVRDHADGRDGVVGHDYEAYEEPKRVRVLAEIAAEARRRWPDVDADRAAAPHRRARALGGVGRGRRVVAASRRRRSRRPASASTR